MKIRSGFVSNSSSSSFAVIGACLSRRDISKELRDKLYDEQDDIVVYEDCEFEYGYKHSGDVIVVGMSMSKFIDSMQNNETKQSAFERVALLIEKAIGEKVDVEYFQGTCAS
jgi:hypothetical protein